MTDPVSYKAHLEGFDGIRLFAALSVMFSHAYLIGLGSEQTEPFVKVLGHGNIIGLYGVFTFFGISGFLLARSLRSNPSAVRYSVNRVLRILPAFIFCTLVTAFVIGPLFSSLKADAYFSAPGIVDFLKYSLNSIGSTTLPGVFSYDNSDLAQTINASLWSLRYEVLSYVFLLILWILLRSATLVAVAIVVVAAATYTSHAAAATLPGIAYTLPYFAGGIVMQSLHSRFGTSWQGVVACVLALVCSYFFGYHQIAFALFGTYIIIFIGERRNFTTMIVDKIGDCSYGLYLFGWPTEQMVKQLTGTSDPMTLLSISIPIAFALALLSCHLVERPAMKLRKPITRIIESSWERATTAAPGTRVATEWGAKVSFVIVALVILMSKNQWWYCVESLGMIVSVTLAGALLGMVFFGFLRSVTRILS